MTDTLPEPADILVIRSGKLRPAITEPTVIGVVIRTPNGEAGVANAIARAQAVLPDVEYTETLRVIVAGVDGIEVPDDD
jgi:hypothetical protein